MNLEDIINRLNQLEYEIVFDIDGYIVVTDMRTGATIRLTSFSALEKFEQNERYGFYQED